MISINLSVTDEQNEARKKIKATWRDVIIAGLNVLSKTNLETKKADFSPVEENLKQAILHLQNAWKGIKEHRT
jgi:hypothetical protein